MVYLPLMTAAIAPGIALLAYFYLKDRYDAEPIKMVVKLFLLGVIVVFPTMILQRGLDLALGAHPFVYSFGISGFVEEFFKWFIIYLMIYSHSEFDEPYDGIVYAVSISLGFATLENVFYALYNHTEIMTLLWRAFLPVSGHALFGVVMGYYLGKAKFAPGNEKKISGSFFDFAGHLARSFRLYTDFVKNILGLVYYSFYDFIMGKKHLESEPCQREFAVSPGAQ